jgi:secondary thiamine-phosphate synthase enzyme
LAGLVVFINLHHEHLPANNLLTEKSRGFHLITREVLRALPEIGNIRTGLCQVFIQHTSASLTINENADPTVRDDFEMFSIKRYPKTIPIINTIMKVPMICRRT